MIRRHQYYFASAVVVIGLCLSLAIIMPRPAKEAPRVKEAVAIKSDRLQATFLDVSMNDHLGPKPIRVIPISAEASVNQPTTPAVLTSIATAMPTSPLPEEPPHAVPSPDTAVSDLTQAEPVDPPHYRRRYPDICAAHGMRKVETNHGRSWRCAGLARR